MNACACEDVLTQDGKDLYEKETSVSPLSDAQVHRLMRPLSTEGGCLLAISGGPDSSCLLHMAALIRRANPRFNIQAATVDHSLRAESLQEANYVGDWAARLGIAHVILTWRDERPRFAIQEKARKARYALLRDHALSIGASVLVTAHTQDDQAETVFMRLLGGSGLNGLSGMRARSKQQKMTRLRPFLSVSKRQLLATCEARGFPYFLDPSNNDEYYLRVRLRRLLPILAQEGLSSARLATLGERAARADAALEVITDNIQKNVEKLSVGYRFDRELLRAQPKEIMIRLMDRLIMQIRRDHACEDAPRKLQKIEALVDVLLTTLHKEETIVRTLAQTRVKMDHRDVMLSLARPHVRGRANVIACGCENALGEAQN